MPDEGKVPKTVVFEPPQLCTDDVFGSYIISDPGLVERGPAFVGKAVGVDEDGAMVWNYWHELPPEYFDD